MSYLNLKRLIVGDKLFPFPFPNEQHTKGDLFNFKMRKNGEYIQKEKKKINNTWLSSTASRYLVKYKTRLPSRNWHFLGKNKTPSKIKRKIKKTLLMCGSQHRLSNYSSIPSYLFEPLIGIIQSLFPLFQEPSNQGRINRSHTKRKSCFQSNTGLGCQFGNLALFNFLKPLRKHWNQFDRFIYFFLKNFLLYCLCVYKAKFEFWRY